LKIFSVGQAERLAADVGKEL